jgi:large subunit ribosomal protein L32
MAVQKSRKTPSKRGMHRSHDHLSAPALSTDPTSGETHLRHRVIDTPVAATEE